MAASVETCCCPHPQPAMNDNQGSHRFYHPTVWGDFFLGFRPFIPTQCLSMKSKAEVMKEGLRTTIVDSSSVDLPRKLELIDTLQQLGLDYHYGKEINDLLCGIHDAGDEASDLHTVALRFYLLRKQGFNVSQDVFRKFIDAEGKITCNDTRSLLGMYNAAHVRTHGEETLNSAISYTKDHLQHAMEQQTISPSILLDQVRRMLETPLFRRPRRVEARHFISVYERMRTRNEAILEFAKLDFSILQALYCEELRALTLWWKELQLQDHLSFAQDMMVEMHFWMLGVLFEPQYSYGRIVLTKFFTFISIFDDIYDSYITLEESKLLTMAMERWDEQATEHLTGYMKFFCKKVLATMKVMEKDLDSQGNKHADYVKKLELMESHLHACTGVQEATRKDVERASGVLQAHWGIVRGAAMLWDSETLWQPMTCCVILHNMIVEDECGGVTQTDDFEMPGEQVHIQKQQDADQLINFQWMHQKL